LLTVQQVTTDLNILNNFAQRFAFQGCLIFYWACFHREEDKKSIKHFCVRKTAKDEVIFLTTVKQKNETEGYQNACLETEEGI